MPIFLPYQAHYSASILLHFRLSCFHLLLIRLWFELGLIDRFLLYRGLEGLLKFICFSRISLRLTFELRGYLMQLVLNDERLSPHHFLQVQSVLLTPVRHSAQLGRRWHAGECHQVISQPALSLCGMRGRSCGGQTLSCLICAMTSSCHPSCLEFCSRLLSLISCGFSRFCSVCRLC